MMNELERVIYINNLFQIYGKLLSDTQQEIITDYYEYNLSLSEIAENRNISRAAVDDALKKGVSKLEKYEEDLKIYQRNEDIKSLLNKLKENNLNDEEMKIIKEIEGRL